MFKLEIFSYSQPYQTELKVDDHRIASILLAVLEQDSNISLVELKEIR